MEIKDNSKQVLTELEQKIERGLKAIGKTAVTYAMRQCPVGTPESTGWTDKKGVRHPNKGYIGGTLRNSIDSELTEDEVHIGTNVEYAVYVESDDTKWHAPGTNAHFLRNSISDHGDHYKKILEAALK